jgi:hypothetical protein
MLVHLSEEYVTLSLNAGLCVTWLKTGDLPIQALINLNDVAHHSKKQGGSTMLEGYEVRISDKQRKMIMRALATTLANSRRSTSGGILGDTDPNEWTELISVFGNLNSKMTVAEQLERCRYRLSCPHARQPWARQARHHCVIARSHPSRVAARAGRRGDRVKGFSLHLLTTG